MEQKVVAKPPSEILKYGFYLFIGMVILGIGVYLYMWKMTKDVKRDVEQLRQVPLEMDMETDEQIEEKVQEIQKYLLQHPPE